MFTGFWLHCNLWLSDVLSVKHEILPSNNTIHITEYPTKEIFCVILYRTPPVCFVFLSFKLGIRDCSGSVIGPWGQSCIISHFGNSQSVVSYAHVVCSHMWLHLLSCFSANRQCLVRGRRTRKGQYCWFHFGSVLYQVGAFGGSVQQIPCSHHLQCKQAGRGRGIRKDSSRILHRQMILCNISTQHLGSVSGNFIERQIIPCG